ncbi:fluoride efflux transporter FluC [Gordonia neofelifaecis]|uniref:Fluoride-specific ion channel FluC n=1 Tax=Gordonia neofelifaecis NRRL B-59395 TaxID=644548 RepID=F1YJW9_9ACTN|nr:CrcB family protein [Gordonia neofelifaecis]EGD55051.1 CrcB protein [Gordonia neofelifaecis NRRL B-59395]
MIFGVTVLAGALGAVARYLVDYYSRRRWPSAFPGPTFAINLGGSLLIGFIAGLVMFAGVGHGWQVVIGTGFCGGFTTFSTAAVETVRAEGRRAVVYGVGTLVGSVVACGIGIWLGGLV